MIKKTRILALLSIGLMCTVAAYANPPGPVVRITQDGAVIASTNIQICLNARDPNHPLTCQNFTITQSSVTITPVASGQTYPNARVRVSPSSSGFSFQTDGGNCTPNGRYCLFTMSSSSPKTVNANSTSNAIGQAKGGGVVACSIATGGPDNLIAADADNSTAIPWGPLPYNNTGAYQTTSATNEENGSDNTTKIVDCYTNGNNCSGGGVINTYAAGICSTYAGGGFTDWFLPSKNQLNCLYDNKDVLNDAGAGFANDFYWSSTENIANFAWDQDFSNGKQFDFLFKVTHIRVRCVRAFTP